MDSLPAELLREAILYYAAAAAAAKSLQLCPTLCDPIDGSPPGSPVPGILPARTLEWVAISFSNAWRWKVKVKSFSRVWLLETPWTAAHQALCISVSLSGDSDLILCLKILYIYFYLRMFGFLHNVAISIWHSNNIFSTSSTPRYQCSFSGKTQFFLQLLAWLQTSMLWNTLLCITRIRRELQRILIQDIGNLW